MGRLDEIRELTRVRFLLFLREPEAIFWVFVFPLVLASVLGFAFRNAGVKPSVAGVMAAPGHEELLAAFERDEHLEVEVFEDQAEADKRLHAEKLIGDLILKRSEVRAVELAERHRLEKQRLEIAVASVEAQLAAKRATVEQFQALYNLRLSQKEALTVRAGIQGVLQEVPVEVGQEVTPGTNLARVAQPDKLKAQLRIAETQAKDIEVGQKAVVDTRNGVDGA